MTLANFSICGLFVINIFPNRWKLLRYKSTVRFLLHSRDEKYRETLFWTLPFFSSFPIGQVWKADVRSPKRAIFFYSNEIQTIGSKKRHRYSIFVETSLCKQASNLLDAFVRFDAFYCKYIGDINGCISFDKVVVIARSGPIHHFKWHRLERKNSTRKFIDFYSRKKEKT